MTSFCVPESLIMRAARCRYCPADHDWDIEVNYCGRIGIRTCNHHRPEAERDCNAHMHKTSLVRLRDALITLATFFDALPETFSVIRKSGAVDPGWRVHFDDYEPQFIMKIRDVDWGIPVIKGAGEEAIAKAVRIKDFLNPALTIPGITAEIIQQTLAALDTGIYKADADAQDLIATMIPTEPDHPYMQIMQTPTGELVRAFVPPTIV